MTRIRSISRSFEETNNCKASRQGRARCGSDNATTGICNIIKSKQGVAWQGQIRVKNNDDLVVFVVVVVMNFAIDDDLFWIIYIHICIDRILTHTKNVIRFHC